MLTEFRLKVAAITHQGKAREHHEDSIAVESWVCSVPMEDVRLFEFSLERPVLCLVADGMGGHAAGEVASRYAADRFATEIEGRNLDDDDLSVLLQGINKELFNRMAANPAVTGMGTTVAGLLAQGGGAQNLVFNVGDSRVYRVQDGFLAQLSTDDVAGARTTGDGTIVKTGRITQALGGASTYMEILPHVLNDKSCVGRTYLLCSDGLTDMVSLDDMEASLMPDLVSSVRNLFAKAMAGGGHDNISILLARIEGSR